MYSDSPVVTAVTPLQNFHLDLSFSSGERKIFNMQPYLEKGLFRELKKPENFNNLFLANNTVNWLNGDLDISPSTLYLKSASLS